MNLTSSIKTQKIASSAATGVRGIRCRNCDAALEHLVVDLGLSPLCESLVHAEQLNEPEKFYPLRAYVCDKCWLVQLHDHVSGVEIFDGSYAYLSSMSDTWLEHCADYTRHIVERLHLNGNSHVVEIASNDGYLLKNFVDRKIPCLGIEPASSVAEVARAQGVPVCTEYFGENLARRLLGEGKVADLMIGNNVLAHVPDLHDFVEGFRVLLADQGTITFEFPHLLNLLEQNQFDTIYQEHYCYLSLIALSQVFESHQLRIYDLDFLPTHGGSLRIYVCHQDAEHATALDVVAAVEQEYAAGLNRLETYRDFAERVCETKWRLLEFLIQARRAGKRVVGYGAPGKGNTLLNYCGIREDLVEFTVDRNELKQGTYLVGSRIPVYAPEMIEREQPDYLLILPWNLKDEICEQMSFIRQWGGKFIIPIPQVQVVD